MSGEAQFDAAKNITSIAGNRIVFHCHHDNVLAARIRSAGS